MTRVQGFVDSRGLGGKQPKSKSLGGSSTCGAEKGIPSFDLLPGFSGNSGYGKRKGTREAKLPTKGNVFKNKRVLIESIRKSKAEKAREKTLSNQFEAKRVENKASWERKFARREECLAQVVENHLPTQSLTWDSQTIGRLSTFRECSQFLMVVKELKLPDASDLETLIKNSPVSLVFYRLYIAWTLWLSVQEAYEIGSAGRVIDYILALKAYHEWKQINGGTGVSKCTKSPLLSNSRSKNFSRPLKVSFANAEHAHCR
ncbi:hypothetical protein Dimus_008207 [Dionaea muscipula]